MEMEQIKDFVLQNQNKVFGSISAIIAAILFLMKSELFTSLLLLAAVIIPLLLIEVLFNLAKVVLSNSGTIAGEDDTENLCS